MNVDIVLAALAGRLQKRTGLRVYDFEADSVSVPSGAGAAVIPAPVEIDYDQAKASGLHSAVFEIFVLVPATDARQARKTLVGYQSTTGTRSVYKAIEDDPTLGGAVSTASVLSCSVRTVTVGDVEYRAAIFAVEIFTT